MTPWTDRSLSVWSLNDAYRIPGFARADRWFDFHPMDRFFPTEGPMYAHQIPHGYYARPKGHIEWLKQQTIPVYLHPDYKTQHPDAANWKHAQAFPRQIIEDYWGDYETSSPAWMMAQAVMEGVKELHIYGIHLATEFEYMRQRPNFEFFCGCILGRGKRTKTVKNGLRYYESADGLIVIPEQSPILQEGFQYAFDPRPDGHLEPLKWELHKVQLKRGRAQVALNSATWWNPTVMVEEAAEDGKTKKRRALRSTVLDNLIYFDALAEDVGEQLRRASMSGAM